MTTFDERQKGFEDKYAHDEELMFKARAHAVKLLGLWVAEKAGLSDGYAGELVNLVGSGKSEEAVLQKVQKDALQNGQNLSLELLQQKLEQCMSESKEWAKLN